MPAADSVAEPLHWRAGSGACPIYLLPVPLNHGTSPRLTSMITSPKEIVMLGYEGSPSQRLMNWVPQLVVLFSEGLETSGGGNFLGGGSHWQ